MRLFLDSANLAKLQPLLSTGVFYGVTTNPLILRESGLSAEELPSFAKAALQAGAREVYLQAWGSQTEDLYRCAQTLAGIDERVVVKLPATQEGLSAASRLARESVRTCITAVYTPFQVLLASAVGAAFVAPYLGRINDTGHDGYAIIAQMAEALRSIGSGTEILAASIRSTADLTTLAQLGVRALTFPINIAERLFQEPMTLEAARVFEQSMREVGR